MIENNTVLNITVWNITYRSLRFNRVCVSISLQRNTKYQVCWFITFSKKARNFNKLRRWKSPLTTLSQTAWNFSFLFSQISIPADTKPKLNIHETSIYSLRRRISIFSQHSTYFLQDFPSTKFESKIVLLHLLLPPMKFQNFVFPFFCGYLH